MNAMMKRNAEDFKQFEGIQVKIPRTVVICTDIFDQFIENNNLLPIGVSDLDDEVILEQFLEGELPSELCVDLETFLESTSGPIAVRSSSLMEDSHYHPFAGTYSTYMVAQHEDPKNTIKQLEQAIKAVYASTFYRNSKNYLEATSSVVEEEKMAVVLQEVVGKRYGNRYYPSFSGVGRSLNFYPIEPEQPEDGVCNIAVGLGKQIVDGGISLRFSPRYPERALQTTTLKLALSSTQNYFWALDLKSTKELNMNEGFNLERLPISEADKDGALRYMASTFDVRSGLLVDNVMEPGRRVITFANILKHKVTPLAPLLNELLKMGQREMGCPVEIEFSVNLNYGKGESNEFYLLQIRPIAKNRKVKEAHLENIKKEDTILEANSALGNGVNDTLQDVVYIKSGLFDAAHTPQMAKEVEEINRALVDEKRHYILIGPGRWGSSDPWLGIPIEWSQISNARAIAEIGLTNYRIDPSQGTHFFQNVTSFKVNYFTVNPYIQDGSYDESFLDSLPAEHETAYVRHVRLVAPAVNIIDGVSGKGVILKPNASLPEID